MMSQSLAVNLRLLSSLYERWLQAWNVLPHRLCAVNELLARMTMSPDVDLARRAQTALILLAPFYDSAEVGRLDSEGVKHLASLVSDLVEAEKLQPDHRLPGTMFSELHGRLENLSNLLANAPMDIMNRTDWCISYLADNPGQSRGHLSQILSDLRSSALVADTDAAAVILNRFTSAFADYPILPLSPSLHIAAGYCHRWIVLGIEDDPVWQEAIRNAVDIVRMRLPGYYAISCEIAPDRQSAENRVRALTKGTDIGNNMDTAKGEDRKQTKLLAIVDLGIPAKPGDAPSRDQGLQLLEFLRNHTSIPAVVLTTPPNFIGDHLAVNALGVDEYFLKDTGSVEVLQDCLLRIVTSPRIRRLEIMEDTGRLIKIDDVEVCLEPAVFRTFSVLATASPLPVTREEVVDLLEEKHGGYKATSGSDSYPSVQAFNLARNWAAATEAEPRCPERSVQWLSEERYGLWNLLKSECVQAGIDPNDLSAVAAYMVRNYGSESASEDFDPVNIDKHVYEARKAVRTAFNKVGKTIFPEEELVVTTRGTVGGFAYKIIVTVATETVVKPARQFRVLVVENDIVGWQQPVRQLLEQFGYDVSTASSETEALEVGHRVKPDILCLDMHLPRTPEDFKRDPQGGDSNAGLRVMASLLDSLPNVQAVILTSLADQDCLRTNAGFMGIRVTDFVDKRIDVTRPWEAELVSRMHRIQQEIRREAVLPLPSIPKLPYIHLWRSRCDERYVEVFGEPWELTENQNRLLWLLAEKDNRPVPSEEIMEAIWGQAGTQNALKKLVQSFRARIALEWFGIADSTTAKKVGEGVLANDAKAGWMLNAVLVIDD